MQHPLAKYLAGEAVPVPPPRTSIPDYDPESQLQVVWKDVESHMDLLCSSGQTGDPDTVTATTAGPPDKTVADLDSDDSGT